MRYALFFVLLFLAGCVQDRPQLAQRTAAPSVVFVVTRNGPETCYARFLGTYPIDQICSNGDNVRYSEGVAPELARAAVKPLAVEALFDSIPVERVIERRRKGANP